MGRSGELNFAYPPPSPSLTQRTHTGTSEPKPWAWRQRSPAMGMGNVASPRPSVWVRWRTYGALGLRGLTAVNIHDFRSPSPPLKRGGARKIVPCRTNHDQRRARPQPHPNAEDAGNAFTRQVGLREKHTAERGRWPRGGGSTGHGIGNKNKDGQRPNRIPSQGDPSDRRS